MLSQHTTDQVNNLTDDHYTALSVVATNMARPQLELHLISVSSTVGEPADCDLVFRLGDQKYSDLPNPAQCSVWEGRTISPLRDRLMVDWIFSKPEARHHLTAMTTSINDAIRRQRKEPARNESLPAGLRVAVVCKNGAQLSPCFVERLYEVYHDEPPCGRVNVTREHWDAFRGDWGHNKDFIWQHTRMPNKFIHTREALQDELWVSFPTETNMELEKAFQADPFSSRLQVGNCTVDFEGGTMYNRVKLKEFWIRCTMVSQSRVLCRFLGHEAYLSAAKSYRAAGILPYSVHPKTGEAVFLIGRMTYGYEDWCDFGGLKHMWEKPRHAAARECFEETLGILGSASDLATALKSFVENNAFKVVNEDTDYVSHFLRVTYQDFPAIFTSRLETKGEYVKVDMIRWVPLSSLRGAVRIALTGQLRTMVEPIREDGMVHLGSLPLRVEFVHTLCIADKLGILDSIEHIAKQLHPQRQNRQPSAVPYVSHPKPRKELKKLSTTAQAQLCKAEPVKDHCAALLHQTEHSSQQQTEPVDSFQKKKQRRPDDVEHLGNVLEAATLSNLTSGKSDTSPTRRSELSIHGDESSKRGERNASRDARRDKKEGRHSNEKTKTAATVIHYYGMGAGRYCT